MIRVQVKTKGDKSVGPLKFIHSVISALRTECFQMAEQADVFLEVDEAGNIWLGEGNNEECYRVYGWNLTHRKLKQIIATKELLSPDAK